MASEKAKALAAKQKAQLKAEKQRRKQSNDPKDWGQVKQVVEAYKATARINPKTNLYLGLSAVGGFLIMAILGLLGKFSWWAWVPLSILMALTTAMLVLTMLTKKATFTQYGGQPGAAQIALQNLNKKKYTFDVGIEMNRQLDMVHRVVGPCGIVLVAEGQPGRVKPLLTKAVRKHEHVYSDATVTILQMGDGKNQVKLTELQKAIQKLPKTMEPYQLVELRQRLKGLDERNRAPLPKGPMPTIKGINRALRGR